MTTKTQKQAENENSIYHRIIGRKTQVGDVHVGMLKYTVPYRTVTESPFKLDTL